MAIKASTTYLMKFPNSGWSLVIARADDPEFIHFALYWGDKQHPTHVTAEKSVDVEAMLKALFPAKEQLITEGIKDEGEPDETLEDGLRPDTRPDGQDRPQ